jgi:hypothetical protein
MSKRNWIISKLPITILIIWFLVGFGLVCSYGEWEWQVLTGIATWVLAGSVFFAFWQIREARKSTNAQLAVELFKELRSEETKSYLRFIYQLRPEDIQLLCSIDRYSIDSVLDKFELLGALVKQRIINETLAIEAFAGPPALRCWHQLAEYIRNQEKDRGGYFVENYEVFTRRTVECFEKEHIEIVFHRIGAEDKPLVKDLRELIDKNDDLRPRNLEEIKQERKNKAKTEKNKKASNGQA